MTGGDRDCGGGDRDVSGSGTIGTDIGRIGRIGNSIGTDTDTDSIGRIGDSVGNSIGGSNRGPIVARLRAAGCVNAEQEAALLCAHAGSAAPGADLERMVAERASGRPLEYVLGWAMFAGLRIPVTDGVFVPRRRSELLARCATAAARERAGRRPAGDAIVVVDLCCGAGALGAVLASRVPDLELHGVDIDPDAVRCATAAVARYGGVIHRGDLYAPLPAGLRGRVDVLIANAPYVPTAEIALLPAEAREHERRAALDGGGDGLAVARRIVAAAPGWLSSGGVALIECAAHQAEPLRVAASAAGLRAEAVGDDDLDATVLRATRAGAVRCP